MVYTITLNPSLDYIMRLEALRLGVVNRSAGETATVGGKGINVSKFLTQMGVENIALGFIAGFTGEQIYTELQKGGCKTDFINIDEGFSRINVKLKGLMETDINAEGPNISDKHIDLLFNKLDLLRNGDVLVLAGSAPKNTDVGIYEQMLRRVSGKGIITIADTSGDLLRHAIKGGPFLIKPNIFELEQICGIKLNSVDEIVRQAGEICEKGVRNVIVSMDKKGAVLISDSGVFSAETEKIHVINTTGAGDALVAGFISEYLKSRDMRSSLEFGVRTATEYCKQEIIK